MKCWGCGLPEEEEAFSNFHRGDCVSGGVQSATWMSWVTNSGKVTFVPWFLY